MRERRRRGLIEQAVLRAFRFPEAMTEGAGGNSEELGKGTPTLPPAAITGDGVNPKVPAKAAPEAPKTYKRIEMPTNEQIMMEDFMNNCLVKTVMATVLGSALGAAMGIFFGAFEPMQPGEEKLSVFQTLKNVGRTSLQKAGSYAKGFAAFGALYSAGPIRT